MKPRNNAARLQIEIYDPNQELRKLWERVQKVAPEACKARLEEAKRQFSEIAFDEAMSSNGAIFRALCETFLKQHAANDGTHAPATKKL